MDVDEFSQDSDIDDVPPPYLVAGDVWMVPCSLDSRTHTYLPIVQPSAASLEQRPEKQAWQTWEDELLKSIILAEGTKHWTSIAKALNDRAHNSVPMRHGKQCRERWYNHLDPNLRKGNWTREEDLFLLEKQLELGNHWSEISKLLVGRNENSVKNRFKSLVRKAQKELPAGTDPIRWLIAEKRDQELELSEGNSIQLISPMLSSSTFDNLRRFSPEMPPMMPRHEAAGIQMCAVDSVKRGLRSMEQPRDFAWTRQRVESESKDCFSPSSFLA